MNNKVGQLVVFCLGLAALAYAQELEHYLPVGFQNPALKSGQHIFSVSYNNSNLEIGLGAGREYPVAVVHSPAGEARETMRFPLF